MNGKNASNPPMTPMNSPSKENFGKQVSVLLSYNQTECYSRNIPGKVPTPTDESKPLPTSTRKTPTLKYSARKTNTEQDQRAKTVDVVRLKTG